VTWEFFIEGTPAPGGSKSAFVLMDKRTGKPRCRPGTNYPIVNVTDDAGKANKEWRKVVAWTALKFMMSSRAFPKEVGFKVEYIFFLRRPNDHYTGSNRERGILKPDAPPWHLQKPDALKFARSTEDALTGIVWADDSQTVRICSEKRWAENGQKAGCTVRIIPLTIEAPQQSLL